MRKQTGAIEQCLQELGVAVVPTKGTSMWPLLKESQCRVKVAAVEGITLKKGDIIFGAEGNEKGRSLAIIEEQSNTITNIHGITLNQKQHNLTKGIFVKLFLDYYRANGMIDSYAVGGNGGSLAIKYWDFLKFPNFPIEKENQIVKFYHNPSSNYETSNLKLDDFLDYDNKFNQEAGIYELDKSLKYLQEKLNDAINAIVDDIEVKIEF